MYLKKLWRKLPEECSCFSIIVCYYRHMWSMKLSCLFETDWNEEQILKQLWLNWEKNSRFRIVGFMFVQPSLFSACNCWNHLSHFTQDILNVMGAIPNECSPIVRREKVGPNGTCEGCGGGHRYVFCEHSLWPQGVYLSNLEASYRQLAHHIQMLSKKIGILHSILSDNPTLFVAFWHMKWALSKWLLPQH